ncbi:DNA-directed RNA polymerase subunit beta [Lactobacillus sp. PV034]|uniref:DNA-directed RNA polymerase subunit beta n=1 Tax=Lactobacillus sp. PV034 TaxID=2594495 RepID=UPI002ACD3B1C|nr:DNA-directed RNA polymerase subunit beta [Lactobacillus sp. PV034]QNQ80650.1 DNA-directed RNA polymerase subunit beta [Lactobacillus sp. PV034]
MNNLFNSATIINEVKKIGKFFLLLCIVMLIGAFVGCGIASGNPFNLFFPSTWIHLFQFLS